MDEINNYNNYNNNMDNSMGNSKLFEKEIQFIL